MNKILWILFLIIFSIGNSSELVQHGLYQYCIECLTKYYRKKQNITEGQIEDFKIFDGYNKVYYRKLNFDKETYPYYIEILLSDKNKRLPHKEEEVVYRNLAEKKLKNIHFPSKKLKYYIENYAYDEKMSDKAIMQDNSLYKYDFVQIIDNTQYRDGDKEFNSPERYVVQQKIDLTNDIEKIFDNFIESPTIRYDDIFKEYGDFKFFIIKNKNTEKKIAFTTEENFKDKKEIQYCKILKKLICEKIDLTNKDRINITEYGDYKKVTIDNIRGFYVLKDKPIKLKERNQYFRKQDSEYIPYEKLKKEVSYLYWLLLILTD
jgi:hypothetical protein